MKTKMTAYHGKQEIKDMYVTRVETHRIADEIVQGVYWENGRGCAVGCTLHSGRHSEYETQLGIPMKLARLQDAIFERLPLSEAKEFPSAFLSAIPVGADLSLVWHKYALWMLIDPQQGVIRFPNTERTRAVIENVAKLYQREIDGDFVTITEWREARAAAAYADAAYAAAYAAAAYAAAYAAAAYDAAADAAYDAAADAAAGKAFWQNSRDKLLELLQSAPAAIAESETA